MQIGKIINSHFVSFGSVFQYKQNYFRTVLASKSFSPIRFSSLLLAICEKKIMWCQIIRMQIIMNSLNMNNNLQNNHVHNIINANTSISLDTLSPKQILGECIDLATVMLKELVSHFIQTNNLPNNFTDVKHWCWVENRLLCPHQLHARCQQAGQNLST